LIRREYVRFHRYPFWYKLAPGASGVDYRMRIRMFDAVSKGAPKSIDHPLRAARELKGWTTRELAAKAGVAHSTIVRVENRLHRPSFSTLARIATALGLGDLQDLLAPWSDERDE